MAKRPVKRFHALYGYVLDRKTHHTVCQARPRGTVSQQRAWASRIAKALNAMLEERKK